MAATCSAPGGEAGFACVIGNLVRSCCLRIAIHLKFYTFKATETTCTPTCIPFKTSPHRSVLECGGADSQDFAFLLGTIHIDSYHQPLLMYTHATPHVHAQKR
jgi:hypothetical protein